MAAEQTIIAVISAVATLGAAGITTLAAVQARQSRRLTTLQKENRALWYYTRHLIDWGYKHGPGTPPPQPPEAIAHLYRFGGNP